MPATLTERPAPPAVQHPPRKRWTRAECERLEALGIFEQQHLELIEGELIDKMGKNRPHVGAATLLLIWLSQVFGGRLVSAEAPIDVAPEDNPSNQPEPDLIVVTAEYAATRFWTAAPQPSDLDLVVEIADSSLPFDLMTKAALYARAGIVEYWVLDVIGRHLIVHRNPENGQYASVTSYNEQESVTPLAAPASSFPIRTVFPE
jgi:Uma2 family endonuclease